VSPERGQPVDLVLEGGGVKGIALAGALATLEERGHRAENLAGASAGAIAATLYAAGYSAAQLREELQRMRFTDFLDTGWEDRVPLVGKGLSVLLDHGVYEGEAFLDWVRGLLQANGKSVFRDLAHPDYPDDPLYGYRVQVIVSDLTERRLLVLPRDAERLGIRPDELDIAWAVRMSMSIPVFFEPVRWRNPQSGKDHVLVDGGLLSNFPVWVFDSDGEPEWPTFGLLLVESEPRDTGGERVPAAQAEAGPVRALISYLTSVVGTMLEAHDRLYLEQAEYARTVPIPTLGVGTTEFELDRQRSDALYEAGRRAAADFLDDVWDFEGYKDQYRRGEPPSRRRQVAEAMRSRSDEGSRRPTISGERGQGA
jgi:NTE family protein